MLLVLSVVLLPLFGYLQRPRGARLADRIAGLTGRHPATALAAAAVPMMVTEAAFGPDVNTGGWERLVYLFPFLYGFLIAGDARFEPALARARWPALAAALLATSGLLAWAAALNAPGVSVTAGAVPGWSALQGLTGWAWIVAIMGFAASIPPASDACQVRRVPDPLRRLSPAGGAPPGTQTRPCCLSTCCLSPSSWPPRGSSSAGTCQPLAKYPTLVVISFAVTLVLYELAIRRYRPARLLFGLKSPRPPHPGDAAEAAGG